jgi:hypothetical protein
LTQKEIPVTKATRVLLAASLLLVCALTAVAQSNVRVNVPFDFTVRGQVLQAGTYTIARVADGNPSLLVLRGADGQAPIAFQAGLADSRHGGTSLLFHRYGDTYYLNQVATDYGTFSLPQSQAERMSAQGQTASVVSAGSR